MQICWYIPRSIRHSSRVRACFFRRCHSQSVDGSLRSISSPHNFFISSRHWKPSNISHQIMFHSPITHLKNLMDSTRNRVVFQRQTQQKQINTMKTTGVPNQKLQFPTTDDGSSQSDYSDSTISSFDLRFARIQEVLSKRNAKDAEESRSTTILGMEICTANHAK
jgi:hypothetical protein